MSQNNYKEKNHRKLLKIARRIIGRSSRCCRRSWNYGRNKSANQATTPALHSPHSLQVDTTTKLHLQKAE